MQHFRRLAATTVMGCLLGVMLGAAPGRAQDATPAASAPAPGGYVQRGVPAEATAENAVIAKTRAIAAAQRLAYERMAGELGISRSVSDSQIDSLVDSIIVEQERTTRTGYSGRLTINFNANRVGGRSGGGGGSSSSGGGSASASSGGGDAAPPVTPGRGGSSYASSYIEASASYASMREWLELRRRLVASPEVASVDILGIAVDGARLRIGLRNTPDVAAQGLPASGIMVGGGMPAAAAPGAMVAPPGSLARPVPYGTPVPPAYAPGGSTPGAPPSGPWQIGLARGA
jgi:hypothetical protein